MNEDFVVAFLVGVCIIGMIASFFYTRARRRSAALFVLLAVCIIILVGVGFGMNSELYGVTSMDLFLIPFFWVIWLIIWGLGIFAGLLFRAPLSDQKEPHTECD